MIPGPESRGKVAFATLACSEPWVAHELAPGLWQRSGTGHQRQRAVTNGWKDQEVTLLELKQLG